MIFPFDPIDDVVEKAPEKPKPRSWMVTSPLYPRATLRLCVYALSSMQNSDLLKCILQITEKGHPLAEHPLAVEWRSEADLQEWITHSESDGWIFTLNAPRDNKQAQARARDVKRMLEMHGKGKCPRCKGDMGTDHGRWYCRACSDRANALKRERRRKELDHY